MRTTDLFAFGLRDRRLLEASLASSLLALLLLVAAEFSRPVLGA